MSAALSAARHASTTRAAHMTGSVSSTTAMSSPTTTMHFSKSETKEPVSKPRRKELFALVYLC
jgi:hypothetical protein